MSRDQKIARLIQKHNDGGGTNGLGDGRPALNVPEVLAAVEALQSPLSDDDVAEIEGLFRATSIN